LQGRAGEGKKTPFLACKGGQGRGKKLPPLLAREGRGGIFFKIIDLIKDYIYLFPIL